MLPFLENKDTKNSTGNAQLNEDLIWIEQKVKDCFFSYKFVRVSYYVKYLFVKSNSYKYDVKSPQSNTIILTEYTSCYFI